MKNSKAIICSLLSVFAATAASASLNNAITVPWEGDVTKFHTAVAGQQIILKGVLVATNPPATLASVGTPDSLTFEMLDDIYYPGNPPGTYTFNVNGVFVGSDVESSDTYDCYPGVHTVTVTGSTLSNAWNAASPPTIEVIYSGGCYVSAVDWFLDYGGTDYTKNFIFLASGHNSSSTDYICDGNSCAAFDITNTVTDASVQNPNPTTVQYQWNPGDGNPFSTLTTVSVPPGGTGYPVELDYTYSGSPGTPYVAWLIASDGSTTISNRYLVMLQTAGLDANINIAIDNGLWYLYQESAYSDGKTYPFYTFNSTPCVNWQVQNGYVNAHWSSSTASAVQAFEINGSKETGDFTKDPYAQVVHLGLNWLFNGYVYSTTYPMLTAYNISTQHGTDDPDSNSNGIGVSVLDNYSDYDQRPVYEGGMVMDAIVASGTPGASTGRQFVAGHVATYGDVVQDMCDMYAYGQSDCASSFTVYLPPSTNAPTNVYVADGVPQSLTFTMLDTACYSAGTYTFYLNGQVVGTSTPTANCSCSPGTHTVVVTGSDLTSNWNASLPPVVRMTYSGGTYVSWVTVTVDYGGGNVLTGGLYTAGPAYGDLNMCDGYTGDVLDVSENLADTPTIVVANTVTENDILGGWIYHWDDCYGDNSASQWAAIGMLAAEQAPFNAMVPQWVKNYDDNWLWYSYDDASGTWGGFGYISPSIVQATSPSGLVQMNFTGKTTSDYRWVKVERWLDDNFASWLSAAQNNLYSMYAFTKSQRTALPNPIATFPTSGLDWYRGNGSQAGVAKVLSDQLVANSYYNDNSWGGNLGTPWAIIMLKPNLFSAGPTACFSANPNPGFAAIPITFDPTCSTDPQVGGIANLVKFDWSWGDGTADTITTNPAVVQHAFACATLPCAYPVTLTVYDNSTPQLSASAQQTINITEPPHPPVAIPGGPYIVSLCSCDSLTLDGSASFSPDAGLSQANCSTCPPDHLTAYGWALRGAPYIYTDSTNEIDSLGSGFTTYFPTPDTYNIGLQVTDDGSQSFPSGTSSNLTGNGFTSVTVYAAGPCQVTATPGCQSVAVSWNDIGAATYNVLSSTSGPNAGFTLAATVGGGVTNTSIGATLNQTQWVRVQAINANGAVTMSCAVQVTDTFDGCVCIGRLAITSKSTMVELQWPLVAGATSYNVYRGTAPNVPMGPANRIATGVGTTAGVYVNSGLINGKTYYYRISSLVNGVEQCRSIEVSAKPAAVAR